jgi:hypothetical protein
VAISLKKVLKRIGKRLAILAVIFLIAWIYAKVRYPSEAKDLESQRAAAARLARVSQPQRLDHAAIIETDRKLSSAEFEGRGAGTEGGHKAQEYIASQFRAMRLHCFTTDCRMPFTRWQRSKLHQLIFGKDEIKPNDAANVVGYLRGRRSPDEYLVVSAHFDHMGKKGGSIYYGADDNASGVAALLAIAQYCAAHPPQHSIIFVGFDAEEKGLQGAKTFVRNPPVKKDAILLNVNMDMIGRNIGNEIFISGTYQFPELRPLVEPVRAETPLALLFGHDHPRPWWDADNDWSDSSDQGPFMAAGIPALYVGVESTKDYHKPTDTFEKIDQNFLANAAELVLDVVLRLDGSR